MNILMMTNTYHPILGGLEKSVEIFSNEFRKRGHQVLIVCPEFEDAHDQEKDVFRVPAIQNFNKTDFSVEIPISMALNKVLKNFKPDIVHTHHPFLIGDTALRISAEYQVPIIFTNHTLYEENTHYVPGDSKAMKRFVIELSKGYANLCNQVFVPSESVRELLQSRGVEAPIEVVPTGLYLERFKNGDGNVFRKFYDIPADAFVIGIVGRVAEEKNIFFLSDCVMQYLKKDPKAYFVIVGNGPILENVKEKFNQNGLLSQLICAGVLKNNQLISAYKALDVFAFASHSETQGLVLVEAMAAGTPVVAVDAPGVREVLKDRKNGRKIEKDNAQEFVDALTWIREQPPAKRGSLKRLARKKAQEFAIDICVDRALKLYQTVVDRENEDKHHNSNWKKSLRVWKTQRQLMTNFTKATGDALKEVPQETMQSVQKKVQSTVRKIFK